MPRTLWRYIFIEIARLVLLATVVLVTVIAFAATIKPLADGKLTAAQAVSFMILAVPPMLAYALPFAAGFGTTLAYHRFADDNELTAAKAGGLSYKSILIPGLAVGLLLASSVALLNDQIIPRFLTRMERMVSQDLTQIMVNQLDRGQSVVFGNTEIHADRVIEDTNLKDSLYERAVRLIGVAAVETDDDGNVVLEATSAQAWLLIFKASALSENERAGFDPDDLIAKIVFEDTQAYRNGRYVGLAEASSPAHPLPSVFDDDPKYLTGSQLAQLKDKPEHMSFIESRRLDLARALATAQTVRTLVRKAESSGQIIFNAPSKRSLFINTDSLIWDDDGFWLIVPPLGQPKIEIEEQAADGTVTRSKAAVARLYPQTVQSTESLFSQAPPPNSVSLQFRLELQDVEIGTSTGDSRLNATTQISEETIQSLSTDDDTMPLLARLSSADLLDQAQAYSSQPEIKSRADELSRRIGKLTREVLSKQHERYAMAASCLVMVLTGAVIALRLKDSLPLIVYLWSFFPALGTLILISTGQSATHRNGLVGVPIIWSGVVGLAVYTLITLRTLTRR